MKVISEQYFDNLVGSIIKEREIQAKLLHQEFAGVSSVTLVQEIEKRVGDSWLVRKEPSPKLTPDDINAVANNRFYRKTGSKLLMLLVIILLALAILVNNLRVLPLPVAYGICGVVAIGFVYMYSRKQAEARKQLWKELGREETEG